MKQILATAFGSALLLASACSDMSTSDGGAAATASAAGDMTPTQATPFVAMAGASDLYEIQSSQLALQKAASPAVREFAQMMVQHHQMTTEQVKAAAQAAGMAPPPPQLMPMQAEMIAELQGLSGADFDRAYIRQQIRAHELALALHTTYARKGDTPQLRQVAATARPVVEQHLARVRSMRV
jgi:putative membrane protein